MCACSLIEMLCILLSTEVPAHGDLMSNIFHCTTTSKGYLTVSMATTYASLDQRRVILRDILTIKAQPALTTPPHTFGEQYQFSWDGQDMQAHHG